MLENCGLCFARSRDINYTLINPLYAKIHKEVKKDFNNLCSILNFIFLSLGY